MAHTCHNQCLFVISVYCEHLMSVMMSGGSGEAWYQSKEACDGLWRAACVI